MKRIVAFLLSLAVIVSAASQVSVRFHDEARDTTRLTRMLIEAPDVSCGSPEARVAYFGRRFTGTPYVASTLEDSVECLTVNLDQLDCSTFVETALALAYTVGEVRSSWRAYVYNLRRLRYRGGEVNGYPSRLHYICDWAVDNIHRGNITDATALMPRVSAVARTIDFMSSNRDRYPALADSANFARIRSVEDGYRRHRFSYVKSGDTGSKAVKAALHDGDVIAFVSNLPNLDVTHMGIIVKDSPAAEPHVLHASSVHGKVEVSTEPLADFLRKNRHWIGIRIFRLKE